MRNPGRWPGGRLAVFGPAGTGKTHLLHVFASRTGAVLLPGQAIGQPGFAPPSRPLALDDADAAPSAEALLHLLNAASDAGQPVLLAARTPPSAWNTALPDLASRLRATTAVPLHDPDDGLLRALLARLLADRQLAVDENVQAFLLARLPRSGDALREAACRLDRASLALGRAVTRAVAAGVVAGMEETDEASEADRNEPSPDAPGLL